MRPLKDYPRISAKDINNLKGAMRRAFARSELRKSIIEAAVIPGHSDPSRKQVKVWVRCASCKQPEAKSYIVVDHIEPMIPINDHFDAMPIEVSLARLWCDPTNLQPLCEKCHDAKTAEEKQARKPFAKPRKKKACAKV